MANTLTLKFDLTYVPDSGSTITVPQITNTVTCAANETIHGIQNVGTSEESVVISAVTTPGYMMVRNLDSTNYVEMGKTAGVLNIKLKAGETTVFRHVGTTWLAQANTAAVDIEYWLFSD